MHGYWCLGTASDGGRSCDDVEMEKVDEWRLEIRWMETEMEMESAKRNSCGSAEVAR